MSLRARRRSKQGGQALIEYVLILLIVVAVILGGLTQVNKGFRDWLGSYFGDYWTCLIESGELPNVGGAPSAVDATGESQGQCNALYQNFSVQNGVPPAPGPGGGGGPAASQGSGNENTTGTLGGTQPGSSSGNSDSGSAARAAAARASSEGRANRIRANGRPSGSIEGESKGTGGGTLTKIDGGATNENVVRIRAPQDGYLARNGTGNSDDDKISDRTLVAASKDKGKSSNPNHLMKVERRKTSSVSTDESLDFGFGDFLRYLIIAIMIALLLIVIGGQLLQVSKSAE
jgi:hypothetical protein